MNQWKTPLKGLSKVVEKEESPILITMEIKSLYLTNPLLPLLPNALKRQTLIAYPPPPHHLPKSFVRYLEIFGEKLS
jgi:hypothetical protein